MTSGKLPYRLAERAITAYMATHRTARTADLHRAVEARARRKVGISTTATTLARMLSNREIIRAAQGLWAPAKPDRSSLAAACLPHPIWQSVARVFDSKGDPFMRLEDLQARLRLYSPGEVLSALKAMAKAEIVELKPYKEWAGEGKEGKGVGLTMRYWRPDQLPPIERPADTFRELYGAEPQTLADLLS